MPKAPRPGAPARSELLPVRLGAGNGHRPPAGPGLLSDEAGAAREPGVPPLALFAREERAERIVATCERAEALGLVPGSGLAEARARFPHVDYRPADPEADRRLLEAVADWCDRYTPLVALDGADGLVLDLTGASHLFGGAAALRADLLARLRAQGFAARACVAAHPGTARACVAGAAEAGLVPAGGERAAVAGLSAGPAGVPGRRRPRHTPETPRAKRYTAETQPARLPKHPRRRMEGETPAPATSGHPAAGRDLA